jgi:predicted dehydrogenase
MAKTYRAALIGCSRMGAFIDNESGAPAGTRPPKSHAAGFEACDRTEMVACSDFRVDVMEQVGIRYGVPKDKQYTDYREMIAKERLDIVSVATQPEPRAEIVVHAAESGVRAIYAEKAMASSMQDADTMVEAVERNGVHFALGTHRRWDSGYDKMIEVIESGDLGRLKTLTCYDTGTLFNTASHYFDLLLRLNGDRPVAWVQGSLPDGDENIDGDLITGDPRAHGIIQFEDGVTAYAQLTNRRGEHEAVCENGVVTALNSGSEFAIRREGSPGRRGRSALVPGVFPEYEPPSATLRLIEDLVHSLDTGESPRGGVRVARASTELLFAFIESHRRGGSRVDLPLVDSKLRLQRGGPPKQPKFQP